MCLYKLLIKEKNGLKLPFFMGLYIKNIKLVKYFMEKQFYLIKKLL
jgi:hypothetical protein